MKSKKELIFMHLGILCAFAIYILGTRLSGIGCPFRHFTGIPCPGCGLTRAWWSALHLDFSTAFAYHPLFLLAPPLLFAGFHRGTKMLKKVSLKWQDGMLIAGCLLFILVYIIRVLIIKQTNF